jgi:hypothetical protein
MHYSEDRLLSTPPFSSLSLRWTMYMAWQVTIQEMKSCPAIDAALALKRIKLDLRECSLLCISTSLLFHKS